MNEKLCPEIAVAVLAGGASSRFGTDKALYRLDGQGPTLLERSIVAGQQISDTIAVIGHRRYQQLLPGVALVEDDEPGRGPLGGIATALRSLDRPRVLVLGCDMPCLSVPLLRWMVTLPSGANVVAPRTADGRFQTMHAIYDQSSLAAIDRALAAGSGAVISLLSEVEVRAVTESEMRAFDPRLDSLFSVNHPADIARARQCVWVR